MTTKLQGVLILAIAAALCIGAAAWAEEEKDRTWVMQEGHAMALDTGHDAMFISEDGAFDVADLRDGETRTFGEGDKQVTVTRDGDIVTIDRAEQGEAGRLEIKCQVDKDTCQVMTFEDDPQKVMIIVKKTRECVDGEGDCDATLDVHLDDLDLGKGMHTIIREVRCDDTGNCEEFEDVHSGAQVEVRTDVDDDGVGNVLILESDELGGDKVVLRCPEGDSQVTVDKEEADDTFLCPKHSIPMERSPERVLIKKIKVQKQGD
jgi:hypothetical protein